VVDRVKVFLVTRVEGRVFRSATSLHWHKCVARFVNSSWIAPYLYYFGRIILFCYISILCFKFICL